MSNAPFEKFKVGDFVTGKRMSAKSFRCFWRIHVTPAPENDAQYMNQKRFIEEAISEKLERERTKEGNDVAEWVAVIEFVERAASARERRGAVPQGEREAGG